MVIENLSFYTRDGSRLNYDQLDQIWALRNYPVKIVWYFDGDKIVVEDEGNTFFFETFNNYVVVLFEGNWSKKHAHPHNLVVYKYDGTIRHVIEAPVFRTNEMIHGVSGDNLSNESDVTTWVVPPHKKEIKTLWGKIKETVVMHGVMDVLRKKKGKIAVTVSDKMFFETQYLDVEKGKFLGKANFGGKY